MIPARSVFSPLCTVFALAVLIGIDPHPVAAATDPSVHDIYQAAHSGQIKKAEAMVQQVLASHPDSAKAHYVAAEVYAEAGERSRARGELSAAQKIDPGLSFVKPGAVSKLKHEIGE
jgi:uncharacterized protein